MSRISHKLPPKSPVDIFKAYDSQTRMGNIRSKVEFFYLALKQSVKQNAQRPPVNWVRVRLWPQNFRSFQPWWIGNMKNNGEKKKKNFKHETVSWKTIRELNIPMYCRVPHIVWHRSPKDNHLDNPKSINSASNNKFKLNYKLAII